MINYHFINVAFLLIYFREVCVCVTGEGGDEEGVGDIIHD